MLSKIAEDSYHRTLQKIAMDDKEFDDSKKKFRRLAGVTAGLAIPGAIAMGAGLLAGHKLNPIAAKALIGAGAGGVITGLGTSIGRDVVGLRNAKEYVSRDAQLRELRAQQ